MQILTKDFYKKIKTTNVYVKNIGVKVGQKISQNMGLDHKKQCPQERGLKMIDFKANLRNIVSPTLKRKGSRLG